MGFRCLALAVSVANLADASAHGAVGPETIAIGAIEASAQRPGVFGGFRGKGALGTSPSNASGIVASRWERRLWGFANYANDLDEGPKSWKQFARLHGHLGLTCSAETERKRCGYAFVCKNGACVECVESRDCGEKFMCVGSRRGRKHCVPRDPTKKWSWREVCCTALVVVTAMLSAAAGMGGGGVYVPLLLLFLGLSTKEAVPLSQAMIVGGATVNVLMFCGERHPTFPHRPRIDYEVVMMLNPGLAAGVTVGVVANVVSPQWLIVLILLVTLVLAMQKSLVKGLQQWRKESQAAVRSVARASAPTASGPKTTDLATFVKLAGGQRKPLALIGGCWVVMLTLTLLKAPPCSPMYWVQILAMVLVCSAFTIVGGKSLLNRGEAAGDSDEEMILWTPQTLQLYPLLATVAGFLGGFLGIGGGIIMGPLLLELGMPPEVSQATNATFVFLSSSVATIQFVSMGKAMPAYAVWFTVWVVLATIAGQTGVDIALRRWRRSSPIVLSIAGIIAGSLVMMSAVGVRDVATDLQRGAEMGFVPHHLCQ